MRKLTAAVLLALVLAGCSTLGEPGEHPQLDRLTRLFQHEDRIMITPGQPITVIPQRAAEWALDFLNRAKIDGSDVDRFSLVRSFLQAIADGRVVVQPAEAAAETPPVDPPRPPAPGANGDASRPAPPPSNP